MTNLPDGFDGFLRRFYNVQEPLRDENDKLLDPIHNAVYHYYIGTLQDDGGKYNQTVYRAAAASLTEEQNDQHSNVIINLRAALFEIKDGNNKRAKWLFDLYNLKQCRKPKPKEYPDWMYS